MYITSSFDVCMRYLTRSSISGCSSKKSGNRGRLINISSLNELLSYNKSDSIIILTPPRKDILDYALDYSLNVVGILIDGQTTSTDNSHFTEVSNCPDSFVNSLNCSIRKNNYGIDFRSKLINKPIFLLNNSTFIDRLKHLSYIYNQKKLFKQKSIYTHMKSYPYAVENAEICKRRSQSNFFGDAYFRHYSIKCRPPMINIVWSTLNTISMNKIRTDKSVILLYTKFDFFSIFQPTNVGAQSTAFGVITLLSLAWLFGQLKLNQLLITEQNNKDILLLFSNGENWNYYGTFQLSKLILEKQFPYNKNINLNENNLHPIEPRHIDIIVHIDQLGINDGNTYILYDNLHPFLEIFKNISSSTTILHEISSDQLNSLHNFHSLNINTSAIITNAYEFMNPFYNSYQDTLIHIKNYSSLENNIYILLKTICIYLKLSICMNDVSIDVQESLIETIEFLFQCFLESNCFNITTNINKNDEFYFKEVTNNMKQTFSFLQPFLHQSDVKTYINNQFLQASSYIHDILLNSMAIKIKNTTKETCPDRDDIYRLNIYQKTTNTCLDVSIGVIDLSDDDFNLINDKTIFISNYDSLELLVYMIDESPKDILMLLCGLLMLICGFLLIYFIKKLFPIIFSNDKHTEDI